MVNDMNKKEMDRNVFWVEKHRDFVKLCFAFTPELDEDLNQVDFLYSKIKEKFSIKNYKIFCMDYDNKTWSGDFKKEFSTDGFVKVLVPICQNISANQIKKQFVECGFYKIYHSYHSEQIEEIQKKLNDAIIITHTQLNKCREFTACPIKIDLDNLAVYSVDIYCRNIEKINWDL